MALSQIRTELRNIIRIIKTPETPTEEVVQKRIGTLHDAITEAETQSIVIHRDAAIALRDGKADAKLLEHLQGALNHCEQIAAALAAERSKAAPPTPTPAPVPTQDAAEPCCKQEGSAPCCEQAKTEAQRPETD